MKKSSLCLFGGALIGAGLATQADADVTINDTLQVNVSYYANDWGYGSYALNQGYIEIDTIDFTVNSAGVITLDLLSFEAFDTHFDSMLYLYNNDGNALSYANLVDYNDDWNYTDINGSVSLRDSYISTYLAAGEYTLAIGAYWFGADDYENFGQNIADIFGQGGSGIPDAGQYQLDIYGDVSLPGVPAPASLALLGLGTLATSRRKRDTTNPR